MDDLIQLSGGVHAHQALEVGNDIGASFDFYLVVVNRNRHLRRMACFGTLILLLCFMYHKVPPFGSWIAPHDSASLITYAHAHVWLDIEKILFLRVQKAQPMGRIH